MVNLKVNSDIIKNIDLVIFDKDGTLMELYTYWSNMINYRVEWVRNRLGFNEAQKEEIMFAMGVDRKHLCLRSEGPVGLKKREVVMQAMVDALARLGYSGMHDLCFQAFQEADEISQEHLSEIVKPVLGLERIISNIAAGGCKIAVATTDKTQRARLAIGFLGISDKVNMIVGEDMVAEYKPHPAMIELILQQLSVDKNNAVMVGDAISDVEMGQNAKLRAVIGVCSGLTDRQSLLKKNSLVIENISHIEVI